MPIFMNLLKNRFFSIFWLHFFIIPYINRIIFYGSLQFLHISSTFLYSRIIPCILLDIGPKHYRTRKRECGFLYLFHLCTFRIHLSKNTGNSFPLLLFFNTTYIITLLFQKSRKKFIFSPYQGRCKTLRV